MVRNQSAAITGHTVRYLSPGPFLTHQRGHHGAAYLTGTPCGYPHAPELLLGEVQPAVPQSGPAPPAAAVGSAIGSFAEISVAGKHSRARKSCQALCHLGLGRGNGPHRTGR